MIIKRLIVYTLILAAIYGLFFYLSQPLRRKVSERFRLRAEAYLAVREYDLAYTEWQKSLKYNKNNSQTKKQLELAKDTVLDLSQGLDFFETKNPQLAKKIKNSQKEYPQAKAAIEAVLLNTNEPELALLPLSQAVKMDQEYPQAWQVQKLALEARLKNCPEMFNPHCQKFFQEKISHAKTKLKTFNLTDNR